MADHCTEWEERLAAFLYGELEPAEADRMRAHLDRCDRCRNVFHEMKGTEALLRRWEDVDSPVRHMLADAGESRPAASSRRGRSPSAARRLRAALPLLGAAAALLLLVLHADFRKEGNRYSLSFGGGGREEGMSPGGDPAGGSTLDEGVPLALPVSAKRVDYVDRDEFFRSQAELIRFVATLIRESEDRQVEHLSGLLRDYVKEVEVQRRDDLGAFGAKVDSVERKARAEFEALGAAPLEAGDADGEGGAK